MKAPLLPLTPSTVATSYRRSPSSEHIASSLGDDIFTAKENHPAPMGNGDLPLREYSPAVAALRRARKAAEGGEGMGSDASGGSWRRSGVLWGGAGFCILTGPGRMLPERPPPIVYFSAPGKDKPKESPTPWTLRSGTCQYDCATRAVIGRVKTWKLGAWTALGRAVAVAAVAAMAAARNSTPASIQTDASESTVGEFCFITD